MTIPDLIAGLFNDNKSTIRLAVVGPTSSGKTYLLTDIIGSLSRLGYRQNDRLQNSSLHHSVLELIEDVTDRQGGIRTTEVYACRSHNHYSSDFTGPDKMHLEFLDVPGEVMTQDSYCIFHAVMKGLMACTEKIFVETEWKHPVSKKVVKLIDYYEQDRGGFRNPQQAGPILRDPRQARRQVTLNPTATYPGTFDDGASDIWAMTYMTSDRRRDFFRQKGYEPKSNRKISGRYLFQHFFNYDTDTVVNAIGDAWISLDIDSRLTGGAAGYRGSVRNNFIEVYKNHFYFHYFTFYATDVVVCDKCCVPMSAGLVVDGGDHFSQMMHSLVALTGYADMNEHKNWYLAFKGIDAFIRQEPFRQLYEVSLRDINLVYTQFVTLFRMACSNHIVDGSKPRDIVLPFTDPATMKAMLAGPVAVNDDALDICSDQYQTLAEEGVGSLFMPSEDYTMTSELSIDEHVRLRIKDFMETAPQRLRITDYEGNLLQMPPHVFFTATPIDEDFYISGHSSESNRVFDGVVSNYNHRAFFGSLQLITCILREHDLCPPDYKTCEGNLLTYLYDVRY